MEASGSYQHEGAVRTCNRRMAMIDRYSDLPDQVAHHTLSFLAMKDLTRFGCVSKRCRELYLSTPSLDFDGFHYSTNYKLLELLRALDRYLVLRGVSKIQRFRICWDNYCLADEPSLDLMFRIMTWIHNAARCNVEVLELNVNGCAVPCYSFPNSIFVCGSLRSLLLNTGYKKLKAPSLASVSNLEYLKLCQVVIEDEGFFKWISCSCKCIKELHLDYVSGIEDFTIESSSLISFSFTHSVPIMFHHNVNLSISGEKLETLYIDWGIGIYLEDTGSKILNLFSPNLKHLKWIGNLVNHQNLGKLMSLEKAELSLKSKADGFNFLCEVLCSICRVEVLILNEETTLALLKGGSIPGLLENVCSLCIHIGSFSDALVLEMASIFGSMRNLSTLEIKSGPYFREPKTDCSGFKVGYWRLHKFSFIPLLKEATIELCEGSNGVQFAKYILEHAQNLNKMMLVHSPWQQSMQKMLKKSKMASNATLVLKEDRNRRTIIR